MGTISASMVKQLREQTGAGMMDCKEALTTCDGDIEKAVDFLRKKGLAKAAYGTYRTEHATGKAGNTCNGFGDAGVRNGFVVLPGSRSAVHGIDQAPDSTGGCRNALAKIRPHNVRDVGKAVTDLKNLGTHRAKAHCGLVSPLFQLFLAD